MCAFVYDIKRSNSLGLILRIFDITTSLIVIIFSSISRAHLILGRKPIRNPNESTNYSTRTQTSNGSNEQCPKFNIQLTKFKLDHLIIGPFTLEPSSVGSAKKKTREKHTERNKIKE